MNATGIISLALVCLNLIACSPKLGNEKAIIPEDISACPSYEGFYDPGGNIIALKKDRKFGFIDSSGNTVIPFQYDNVLNVQGNYITVRSNRKYGLINIKNEVEVPFLYDYISPYKDEYLVAEIEDMQGVINLRGETVIPFEYGVVSLENYSDSHKVFYVRKNDKCGIMDTSGNFVIPMIYDRLTNGEMAKTNTFLVAQLGDKYGALDYSGNILLPFEYENMEVAGENIVSLKKEEKWAVLDIYGNIIAPYGDKGYGPIGEGFFTRGSIFDEEGIGLLNEEGKVIFPEGIASGIRAFNCGYIKVIADGGVALCDFNGKFVTKPDYDLIMRLKKACFCMKRKDGAYSIWNNGKETVLKCELTDVLGIDKDGFISAVNSILERVYIISPEGEVVKCFEGNKIRAANDYYIVEQGKDNNLIFKLVPKN